MEPSVNSSNPPPQAWSASELLKLVQKQLDQDQERNAQVAAASAGELPYESQYGATLDLSYNGIVSLPEEVILLIKDRVERLALCHNANIIIPNTLAQCSRLRYLNLRETNLTHFPEPVLDLHQLEILDLSKNAISTIPEDIKRMTNLKFLAIVKNRITRLPLALAETNLAKLKFDENPIQFPPQEVLTAPSDNTITESMKDKELCLRVKRYMKEQIKKQAPSLKDIREQMRTPSEEDLSETNADTPRPPKRGVANGRFPVKPSISSIDAFDPPKADSPQEKPPPIPERSHARKMSPSLVATGQSPRHPGVAPLFTGANDGSRSRSETVSTSASVRSRRQGFVPRRTSNLSAAKDAPSQASLRSSNASTITPGHSRVSSTASSRHGYPSGGDISSESESPNDGPESRYPMNRQLSSLPESRNSTLPISNSLRAVKRLIYTLQYLKQPIGDLAKQFKGSCHERAAIERQLYSASHKLTEVSNLLDKAHRIIDSNSEVNPALLTVLVRNVLQAMRLFGTVAKELKRTRHRALKSMDAFHIRFVINSLNAAHLEVRNTSQLLGSSTKDLLANQTPRASQAFSHRTITPTSAKSSSKRRGPTVLPSMINTAGLRPAPVPLSSNSSRTNTLTSAILPSSAASAAGSNGPSRSNTMRSAVPGDLVEPPAAAVYHKVRELCENALRILEPVGDDLCFRLNNAQRANMAISELHYASAVSKCEAVVVSIKRLYDRIWSGSWSRWDKTPIPASLVAEWTEFVQQLRECHNNRLNIGTIRHDIKPIHVAIKETNRYCQLAGLWGQQPPTSASVQDYPVHFSQTLLPPLPAVPATPAAAALGPAVQATFSNIRQHHDRNDTVMQPPVPAMHSRR